MALVKADRVKETSTSTGTGNFTLDGAVAGYRAFSSVMAVNDTFFYTILHSNGLEWETGYGTLLTSTSFQRTVFHSGSSGGKCDFSAGTKEIFVSQTAIQAISGIAAGPSTLSTFFANFYLGANFLRFSSNLSGNQRNIAIGDSIAVYADSNNGSFERNICIGNNTLYRATSSSTDSGNVSANVAIGFSAGFKLNSGISNIFIGSASGGNLIDNHSHSDSIFIGRSAGPQNRIGDNNCIVIGAGAVGNGPNTATIGGPLQTDCYLIGNVIPTGAFKPASIADASAPTNAIYYSTTANKLVYKDSTGTVNNLY